MFFVPIEFLNSVIYHLRFTIKPQLPTEILINFENWSIYLELWYIKNNAKFLPFDWNYYIKVSETSIINSSTNAIESVNKKLKAACSGKITFEKACEILVNFKSSYISEYQMKVLRGNLNPRCRSAKDNKTILLQILHNFNELSYTEKCLQTLDYYAFKFGTKNPFPSYSAQNIVNIEGADITML